MTKGYYLVIQDKTTCGGIITEGEPTHTIMGKSVARERDRVTCGKHLGMYIIVGHIPGDSILGRKFAGTLHSYSSCPCKARFIPSRINDYYKFTATEIMEAKTAPVSEPEQYPHAAKKQDKPAALPLPARIYTTQRVMDDYDAKDMLHGDLDVLILRNTFRLNVDEVSMKVNPSTLKLKDPTDPFVFSSAYVHHDFQPKPMPSVNKKEAAHLMFDEFRELAKLFSFQGEYKHIITEMITHMEVNSGKPYSSPLLDRALKEQILNDRSEQSSLLLIRDILMPAIDYEYGFIPLDKKVKFFDEKGNFKDLSRAILPKFDRVIDHTNGLVISIHDTWATHITLESLEVTGDSYRAKVHYRIQDHFGLDDTDVKNDLFRQFRIFRLWFVLQRWDEYGYKPFITEMNATVEISGVRGE